MTEIKDTSSLAKQLFTMTWPMLFGVLSLMSFQLIDSAFIGQLGVQPLAAQGFTLPIQMLIIGVQVGLGIATTAIIAHILGAKQPVYAKQVGGLVIVLGSVGVALMCWLLWGLREPILSLLGAQRGVLSVVDAYWPWWLLSAWLGALMYFLFSICRANGNTMLPGVMMAVTSAINLALDPIFIFTLELGIQGAAMATIVAYVFGSLFAVVKVFKNDWVSFDWHTMDVRRSSARLFNIMGPAMISQLLPPVSAIFATKVLAGFGAAAVAAWALASRYEFFSIVAVLALTMSMPPMIARLLGQNNIPDIARLVKIAVKFILLLQISIAGVTFFLADPLASLMTSESDVERILSAFLVLVPFSLGPLGICMLIVSASNALAKPKYALVISALRLFAFFLPCMWLGSQWGGIQGLFVGAAVGNCLAGLAAWMSYQKLIRRLAASRGSASAVES